MNFNMGRLFMQLHRENWDPEHICLEPREKEKKAA